jgi:exodeoxyribonuclease VII large subunit
MNEMPDTSPELAAVSVTELNREVKRLLEHGLGRLWVEGEISNIARPASGHVYFSLKDDAAQVRCAFFRQRQRGPTARFKNGDKVLAFGRVSVYEPRGDYQLIVERLEPAGEGALKREFDRLKRKLAEEGLFDEAHKQAVPVLPRRIGVITSPSGAALRDILSVLGRRFPAVPVIVYPAAVQGDAAPAELLAALRAAERRAECDVLIIGRGGGSLEDLHAFNDEQLARAIHACPIPVISAVGHEVDFTIADFVADLRAPTPSGAAELAVPDRADWLRSFGHQAGRIARAGRRLLEGRSQSLDWLARRLVAASPAARVQRQADRLRELGGRLAAETRHQLLLHGHEVQALAERLVRQSPAIRIERANSRLQGLEQRLARSGKSALEKRQHRLALAARALNSVSPLATLERGYAVVLDDSTGKALTDSNSVAVGDRIRARLARGVLRARIEEKSE